MQRRVTVALLALAALAGCGGDESADADRTPTVTAPADARQDDSGAAASAAPEGVRLKKLGGFEAPVFLTAPPGDRRRQFVVEQGGRIRIVSKSKTRSQPFLDISKLVTAGGEQGLLSMAFAPDYARSGLFYVYYTDRNEDQRVVEFRRSNAGRADPESARLVLKMDDDEVNHNGGQLQFGPDRLLYIGTGDGGGADDQHGARGNAQDLGSLLGKLLRIDPRAAGRRAYSIPDDNPFVDRKGARPEIYSYGLRNPWRFSFDTRARSLAIADVGQDLFEEVSYVGRGKGSGANFGWRPFEGNERRFDEETPDYIKPVIVASHNDGYCSITGGVTVRDRSLPGLRGRYIYGDFCRPQIMSVRLPGGRPRATSLKVRQLSSFGEDGAGRVYALSLAGAVYRIVARG